MTRHLIPLCLVVLVLTVLACSSGGGIAPGFSISSYPARAQVGDEVWIIASPIQISGPVQINGVNQEILPWDQEPPQNNGSGLHFRIVEGTTSGYIFVTVDEEYPWVAAGWLGIVASSPVFSGTISIDGQPEGEIPCFIDLAVEITGGTPPFSFEWDFGDGFTTELESPTHDFVSAGPFLPTVRVTDSSSKQIEIDSPIEIAPSPKSVKNRIAAAGNDSNIYLMNSDGTDIEMIPQFPIDPTDALVFSNDMSTLVLSKDTKLWVIDTASGSYWELAEGMNISTSKMPSVSGNGEYIVFKNNDEPSLSNTYLVSRDGTEITKLFMDVDQNISLISATTDIVFSSQTIWEGEINQTPVESIFHCLHLPELEPVTLFQYSNSEFVPLCMNIDGSKVVGSLKSGGLGSYPTFSILDSVEMTIEPIAPPGPDNAWNGTSCDGTGNKVIYKSGSIGFDELVYVTHTDGKSGSKLIWQGDTVDQMALTVDGSEALFLTRGLGLWDKFTLHCLSADGLHGLNLNEVTGVEEFYALAVPGTTRAF